MTLKRILTVSGSLRAQSLNRAFLQTVCRLEPHGVEISEYEGLATLPHFNPDEDREPLSESVADLRARIQATHAILFCIPEYAGALPGAFKNLLDWTIGGGEIYGRPVAWVNVSASPTGAAGAHASLRVVLGYAGARIIEDATRHIPITREDVGVDGLIARPEINKQISEVLDAIVKFIQ